MPKARIINLNSNQIPSLNPQKEPLDKEKLRELSGLHDLSDEQAEEMVFSIHLLAITLYDFVRKNTSTCIDNQQVVNLNTDHSEIQKQAA